MADPSTIDGTFLILQEPATWWDSLLQSLQAVSIIVAAVMAFIGIKAWQRETVGRRKIELAEELLAACYQAQGGIQQARGPLAGSHEGKSRTPIEGETSEEKSERDGLYVHAERLNEQNELFAQLEALSYRFAAFMGHDARKPVIDLLLVRNEILIAVRELIRGSIDRSLHSEQAEVRDFYERMQLKVRWAPEGEDDLGDKINRAIADIEAICRPVLLGGQSRSGSLASWWR